MADRNEKVDQLLKQIEEGTKAIFESDRYKDMMSAMAKFTNYSVNNVLLITMQNPGATLVCGYKGWQEKFNRHVKKGEHGIKILGFAPKTIMKEQPKVDELGFTVKDANGEPVMEKVKVKVPAFKPMYVYDISQTDGEPLPTIYNGTLEGSVRKFELFQESLVKLSPLPISFEDFPGDARGYMDRAQQKIVVREGMSELQTIKTLVHEIAHAQCHNVAPDSPDYVPLDRATREVEAESIAFIVCQHYGLDTSEYSFPYIAGWAGDKELNVLHSSLDRIRTQAVSNIEFLEAHLEQALAAEQTQDTYTVYQLKPSARNLMFMNMDYLVRKHEPVSIDNYQKVYTGPLAPKDTLEDLYSRLNQDEKPEGYAGHSLSVSDVVILSRDGTNTAHFCDSVGFAEVPEFWKPTTRVQKPMSLSERLAEARRAAAPKAEPAQNQALKRPETAL